MITGESMRSIGLILIVLVGCQFGDNKGETSITPPMPGEDGKQGHSIVSQVLEDDGCIITEFYLDVDDSLSVTSADVLQSSNSVCNGTAGEDGLNGDNGLNGSDGTNGTNGSNGVSGHSLVTEIRSATLIECSTSGQALDVYLDIDDTLSKTPGDAFQNSIVTCNGAAGPAGANGTNAVAVVTRIPGIGNLTTTCVSVPNTTYYIRKRSASVSDYDVEVYGSMANCSVRSSRLVLLNSSTNEYCWANESVLITTEGFSNSTVVRSLKFQ